MKIAVISDIHANSIALRAVLDDISRFKVGKIVCLGDIVGYGPSPAEALKLVRESCDIVIAGNHDDAVCGRTDDSEFIDLAGEAVQRHKRELSKGDIGYLRQLKYTAAFEGALFAHGDMVEPKKFYYVEEPGDAEANFKAKSFSLLFVGHTHTPAIFYLQDGGEVHQSRIVNFKLKEDIRYIINPGSVGYPREADGKCLSSYLIYDSTERAIYFRFIPFNVASVLQRGEGTVGHSGLRVAAVAAAGVLLIAIAGLCAALLLQRGNTPETAAAIKSSSSLANELEQPIARHELLLDSKKEAVFANLKLEPSSSPVELQVSYRLRNGKTMLNNSFIVKKSSTKAMKIPRKYNCEAAILEIYPASENQPKPAIAEFQPSAK